MSLVPRPSSLATSYAQNYIPHPGFDWVEMVDTFLPHQNAEELMKEIAEAWTATKEDKAVLVQELQNFQAKIYEMSKGRNKPGENVNLDRCSMNDVLGALKRATARESSSKRTTTYKAIYNIGKYRNVLEQWLSLLPQGDYGSGICASLKCLFWNFEGLGAFTILLDASARIYDMDNYVYECLSSIPAALQKATIYMEIYREQQPLDLVKMSVDLYKAVLKALIACVKYSQKNASVLAQARRVLDSVLSGDNYKKSLKEAIDDVPKRVKAVEEQASLCQHKRIGGIHEMALQATNRQQQTNSIDSIGLKERQIIDILNSLKDHLDSHGCLDRKGHLRETIQEVSPETPRKQRKKKNAAKLLAQPMEPALELPDMILEMDLLSLIAYNRFALVQDLVEAFNVILEPNGNCMRQLSQAVKSDELRTFLCTPSVSSVLTINGNSEEPSTLSPLSLLDGQVLQMLFVRNDPILLIYFCSLHAESWDPRANARGLIASLLGQLLSYPNLAFNVSFIDSEIKQHLEKDDFLTMVQLFLTLLHQLPSDAYVFCIIDEVSVYMTPERREDMRTLLVTLVKQVVRKQTENNLPIFKLLLTDGGSSGVETIVGIDNTLELSVHGEEQDSDALEVVRSVFKKL